MAEYRIYLLDRNEQIVFGSTIECSDDREACLAAEQFADRGMFFQVWDGVRRVFQTSGTSGTLH